MTIKEGKHPCTSFFNSSIFTIVSADDIDFMHSHARVFRGNQSGSWHGTTVQMVQPLPSLAPVRSQCSLAGCIDDLAYMELTSPSESLHHLTDIALVPQPQALNHYSIYTDICDLPWHIRDITRI